MSKGQAIRDDIILLVKLLKSYIENPLRPLNRERAAQLCDSVIEKASGWRRASNTPNPMTPERAEAILWDRMNTKLTQDQIAEKHGTQQSTVSIIWTSRPKP